MYIGMGAVFKIFKNNLIDRFKRLIQKVRSVYIRHPDRFSMRYYNYFTGILRGYIIIFIY